MPLTKLTTALANEIDVMRKNNTAKGKEMIVERVIPSSGNKGPRFVIRGFEGKEFIRMNSNSYLGLSFRKDLRDASEEKSEVFGAGPGAVRFISGTYTTHIELEETLARFHGKEAAMLYSAAYMATLGCLSSLISSESIVISDELNPNCIINAIRMSRPKEKLIYPHLNMESLRKQLEEKKGTCKRVLVITDGIFSMRGDHAPLDVIADMVKEFDPHYEEGVLLIVDDSHGVGAFGETGRGTIEYTNAKGIDVLIGTLGKAFGTNGGYLVTDKSIVEYLHQKAPTYIYSNPISPGEAASAKKAVELIDSPEGKEILKRLRTLTHQFKQGLIDNGFETLPGEHPVVPLMIRDTKKTADTVAFLKEHGVLATGLSYPVVPRGDEEIRFQISAEHTADDINSVLAFLSDCKAQCWK
jgi:glycine C-acetyltransferase